MIIFPIYRRAISDFHNYNQSKTDLIKIKLCIQFTILALFSMLLVTILDGIQHKWPSVFLNVASILCYLMAFFLFKNTKHSIAKTTLFLTTIVLLFFNASREGFSAGNQFIFLPLFACSLLVFNRHEIRYLITVWVAGLACIIFLELTDYSYFKYPNLKPEWNYINYLFCFVLSFVMISIYTNVNKKINRKYEDKLEKLNKKLVNNNQLLAKTNSELDSFVYKASHDLRSPLTSMMGLIELMKTENEAEELQHYLHLQTKLINKLDNYISEILDISRNSQLPVKNEKIDISAMIDSIFIQLNYMENAEKINKEVTIQDSHYYGDTLRIYIILNNLISNAIRYHDPNKEKSTICINISITNKCFTIKVWDNGIGISNDHINNLGKMFYRATESRSGSGLGLYLIKETLQKIDGDIKINSVLTQWSEFVVNIPQKAY